MGEMADYYMEEAEDAWLKEQGASTDMTYQEWLEHDERIEREIRAEKAEEIIRKMMRALSNGTWWITKDDDQLPLNKITLRHARNLVRWLRKRAHYFHDIACLEFAALPEPHGEQAGYMVEEEFNHLNSMDPVEWLMEQPLLVNLKEKIKEYEDRE